MKQKVTLQDLEPFRTNLILHAHNLILIVHFGQKDGLEGKLIPSLTELYFFKLNLY